MEPNFGCHPQSTEAGRREAPPAPHHVTHSVHSREQPRWEWEQREENAILFSLMGLHRTILRGYVWMCVCVCPMYLCVGLCIRTCVCTGELVCFHRYSLDSLQTQYVCLLVTPQRRPNLGLWSTPQNALQKLMIWGPPCDPTESL